MRRSKHEVARGGLVARHRPQRRLVAADSGKQELSAGREVSTVGFVPAVPTIGRLLVKGEKRLNVAAKNRIRAARLSEEGLTFGWHSFKRREE